MAKKIETVNYYVIECYDANDELIARDDYFDISNMYEAFDEAVNSAEYSKVVASLFSCKYLTDDAGNEIEFDDVTAPIKVWTK